MAVTIVSFIGLSSIFITFFLTKGMYIEEMQHINKKEYKLKDLMPTALFIMDKVFDNRLKPNSKVRDNVLLIYGKRECNFRLRMHQAERISLGIMGLIGVLFISMLISVKSGDGLSIANNTIGRPSLGEGNVEYNLQAEIDIDGKKEVKSLTVLIPEKNPNKEVACNMLKKAANELSDLILGDNSNLNVVDEKLRFLPNYPDSNIKIEWVVDTPSYISNKGVLKYYNIGENGHDAQVTANLTYAGEKISKTIKFKVYPKTLTKEDKFQLIEKAIKGQLKKDTLLNDYSNKVKLPTQVEGYDVNIRWFLESESNGAIKFLIQGLLIVIFLMILKDYELKKKVEERNFQVRRVFPEFVIKITLLINAGMTLSRAWKKISKDYYDQVCNGEEKQFLYEEMLETLQDINNGVSEIKAYEDFGKRCRIPEMMRLTSVILQNIRKGNDTLVITLQNQANEAWNVRKNIAKKAGEKASSKLLIPMGIMFIIILLIVMMPAFMSLGV